MKLSTRLTARDRDLPGGAVNRRRYRHDIAASLAVQSRRRRNYCWLDTHRSGYIASLIGRVARHVVASVPVEPVVPIIPIVPVIPVLETVMMVMMAKRSEKFYGTAVKR